MVYTCRSYEYVRTGRITTAYVRLSKLTTVLRVVYRRYLKFRYQRRIFNPTPGKFMRIRNNVDHSHRPTKNIHPKVPDLLRTDAGGSTHADRNGVDIDNVKNCVTCVARRGHESSSVMSELS